MSRCTCIYFEIVTFIPRNCIRLRNIFLHIYLSLDDTRILIGVNKSLLMDA